MRIMVLTLALLTVAGCGALDQLAGGPDVEQLPGTAPTTQPRVTQTTTSAADRVAGAIEQIGTGAAAAGAAISPANPAVGGAITAAGGVLATVAGIFLRRKLVWGVFLDRRAKRPVLWERVPVPGVVSASGRPPVGTSSPAAAPADDEPSQDLAEWSRATARHEGRAAA